MIPLGVHRYTGGVVTWNPPVQPHGIATGPTGSGKTHFLRLIGARSAAAGAEVVILDGKGGTDYDALTARVGVTVHRGPSAVDSATRGLDAEVARRFESGAAYMERPLVAVVDELAALSIPLPGEAQRDTRSRVDGLRSVLARVAFLGRAAGVHLWVGQQRPDLTDGAALTGGVRDQLTARVALGWLSVDAARMVFGTQVQQLDTRAGHGWALGLDGVGMGAPAPIVVDKGEWG